MKNGSREGEAGLERCVTQCSGAGATASSDEAPRGGPALDDSDGCAAPPPAPTAAASLIEWAITCDGARSRGACGVHRAGSGGGKGRGVPVSALVCVHEWRGHLIPRPVGQRQEKKAAAAAKVAMMLKSFAPDEEGSAPAAAGASAPR